MLVTANEKCFYGGKLHDVGSEAFQYEGEDVPACMDKVDDKPYPKPEVKKKA